MQCSVNSCNLPYTKDSVKAGNVTAKYVDTDGHNIAPDEVKSGNIGEDYKTENKTVDGYTFKEVKGNENGKFANKAQEVIYVYTKNMSVPVKPDNHNSSNIVQPVNQKSTKDRANNSSTKDRSNLPDTAAKNAILGMIIGIVVLSVTLGTIDWKRRKM
ncbi:hypothetical protein AN225_03945 [Leuconostoc lactis]|nr:hypothetical protein AN225_03945 [Leuconostoc lactis]TDV87331.1 LPXTG-motif cell wall-anchored protein [Leuconostoc mesenteroides]